MRPLSTYWWQFPSLGVGDYSASASFKKSNSLDIYGPRKAGCAPRRSKARYQWNNGIPMRLDKNVSMAIPDTDGLLILCHCSRVTVHGGNHRARFPAFTVIHVCCVPCACGPHSLVMSLSKPDTKKTGSAITIPDRGDTEPRVYRGLSYFTYHT